MFKICILENRKSRQWNLLRKKTPSMRSGYWIKLYMVSIIYGKRLAKCWLVKLFCCFGFLLWMFVIEKRVLITVFWFFLSVRLGCLLTSCWIIRNHVQLKFLDSFEWNQCTHNSYTALSPIWMPHLLLVFQVYVGYFRINQNIILISCSQEMKSISEFSTVWKCLWYCCVTLEVFVFLMKLFVYLKNIRLVSFTSNLYT